MNAEYFRTMIDYQYWARDRLLAAVEQLNPSDYLAPRPMDYGSIHGTLVHTYAADVIWHSRWNGVSPDRLLTPEDVPDLKSLVERWRQIEPQIREFVGGLTDEDVRMRVVDYRSTEGDQLRRLLWQTLAHLVNHGTNHRSEVAAAATQLGHSPGDLDLVVYFARS